MTEPDSQHALQSNPAIDSAQIIEILRLLLPMGKRKIDPRVADDVGRNVNRLAINFPKEQDEAIAFQCFALIGLAIAKGSKEATKRKPRPVRWLNEAPPPGGVSGQAGKGASRTQDYVRVSWGASAWPIRTRGVFPLGGYAV